jgi:hypothetical protein
LSVAGAKNYNTSFGLDALLQELTASHLRQYRRTKPSDVGQLLSMPHHHASTGDKGKRVRAA